MVAEFAASWFPGTRVQSLAAGVDGVSIARWHDFEAFVARHRDRAVALAWRLCGGDAAAAEDVAQEAFVRAYRGLDGFRSEATLSTWFTRILVNEARRHRRWRWVRERFAGAMPADPPAPAAAEGRDPLLRERVARALARLPRAQREAFVLVRLEGLSVREAAEIAQRSPGTIKSNVHRAQGALRAQLADLDPKRDPTHPQERTR
jgi:RNA polymerase sigma factor (sigma-70 family)